MPLPAIAVGAVFATTIVPMVVKVLAALGIGFITYTGASTLVDEARQYAYDRFFELPASAIQLATLAGFDVVLTMVLSAYTARLVIAGVGGSITKMRLGVGTT